MKHYKFTAKIEEGDGGGAYVVFPFDVEAEFGVKGRVPITATINGIPYTGSLSKYGGQHVLGILKSIRGQIGAKIGDQVEIELRKDDSTRTVDVPAELLQALRANGALAQFENLSYTHRKEYIRWIHEAKTEQTRARRVQNAVEQVKNKAKVAGRSSTNSDSLVS
jgi:antitoxin component of MazEF toxin-antitoxin module